MQEELKLHEIPSAIFNFYQNLPESPTDEDLKQFDNLSMQLKDKVDGTVQYYHSLTADIAKYDSIISHYESLKKSIVSKQESIKSYIDFALQSNNISELKGLHGKVWYKDSEAVIVSDACEITNLPEGLWKMPEPKAAPDKVAIKKYLEANGEESLTSQGVSLEKRKNLQIK